MLLSSIVIVTIGSDRIAGYLICIRHGGGWLRKRNYPSSGVKGNRRQIQSMQQITRFYFVNFTIPQGVFFAKVVK
jgi:hypothetical protein